jgi:site-specific DNA recombinase
MKRAAIYGRYSSDQQNDKSIADQIAACRELCAREGFAVVATFEDRAISGASTVNRPGFQSMMRTAEGRAFDVLVAEDVDRISRDQGDYHTARKRLDFLGVEIHTLSGKVGRIDGSLRALMGEMYLDNLRVHTRRGLEAVVRDGRHAGGKAFGYSAVPGKPGELEIVEAEAEVVREIFADYANGETPRAIAAKLNARSIKPPRGTRWNASTINGNFARRAGLLLNEIYIGEIVWNKTRFVKDPATGKRISRPNTPEQYRRARAPHLRIVDDETWKLAQAIKAEKHRNSAPQGRRPQRLFSGIMRCGVCGSGMSASGPVKSRQRMQCSRHRESGACDSGRQFYRDEVERIALDLLQAHLADPELLIVYAEEYNAERRRLAKSFAGKRSQLERRAGEVARDLDRLIDSIVKLGIDPTTLAAKAQALEAEKKQIAAELATIEAGADVITLHPATLKKYRATVARLATIAEINPDGVSNGAIAEIRQLVAAVIIHPSPSRGAFTVEVKGRLAELAGDPAAEMPCPIRLGGKGGSGGGI